MDAASDVAVPASDAAVPASDVAVPASDAVVPASDVAVPASDAAVPASDAAVPASDAAVPAILPIPIDLFGSKKHKNLPRGELGFVDSSGNPVFRIVRQPKSSSLSSPPPPRRDTKSLLDAAGDPILSIARGRMLLSSIQDAMRDKFNPPLQLLGSAVSSGILHFRHLINQIRCPTRSICLLLNERIDSTEGRWENGGTNNSYHANNSNS